MVKLIINNSISQQISNKLENIANTLGWNVERNQFSKPTKNSDKQQKTVVCIPNSDLAKNRHFLKNKSISFFALETEKIEPEEIYEGYNNVFELNCDDFYNIEILFRTIDLNARMKVLSKKLDISFKNLDRILIDASKFLERIKGILLNKEEDEEGFLEDFIQIYLDYLQINDKLNSCRDYGEIFKALNEYCKKHSYLKKVKYIDIENIKNLPARDSAILLPIFDKDLIAFINIELLEQRDELLSFYIYQFIHTINKFLDKKNKVKELENECLLWEDIFSKLLLPVALISSSGELVLHNTHFSKLRILPKECLKFKNEDKVEKEGIVYHVFCKRIVSDQNEYSYYVFETDWKAENEDKTQTKNISSNELGIISSSIAHELNNPLAGILTAISVLLLEDDWDNESVQALEDMKKATVRCKQLIEIFLGFSKASPVNKEEGSFINAFSQGMNLLRFRMIESNMRLAISIEKTDTCFEKDINTSVLAMIFYLILSEVVTEYSHHKLLTGSTTENVLPGFLHEYKDKIVIRLERSVEFTNNVKDSKLIQYLVDLENLELKLDSNTIILENK